METPVRVEVFYPASTYVWCKGVSSLLGRHPIFVSSPVRFTPGVTGRYVLLTCRHPTCSLCGKTTRYEEEEIGFQDEVVLRRSEPNTKK